MPRSPPSSLDLERRLTSACQAVGADVERWADDKAQGALPGLV
jgi:hypothetical protein